MLEQRYSVFLSAIISFAGFLHYIIFFPKVYIGSAFYPKKISHFSTFFDKQKRIQPAVYLYIKRDSQKIFKNAHEI